MRTFFPSYWLGVAMSRMSETSSIDHGESFCGCAQLERKTSKRTRNVFIMPNVQDEPRPLGAVGSGAWLGFFSGGGGAGSRQPGRRPAANSFRTIVSEGSHPASASISPIQRQQSPPQSPESGSFGSFSVRLQSEHFIFLCLTFKLSHGRLGPLALAPG